MNNTNIGLNNEQRQGSIDILNRVLADEQVLYTKVRKYHWNIKGMQFNDLHKFLEEMYDDLAKIVDDTAERVRSLDGDAIGTLVEFSKLTRLKEAPGDYPKSREMIQNLLTEYEIVIRELRGDIEETESQYKDAGTTDYLTGIMQKHEKTAWMLRSMLAE
ncbi:MAG: DNA starvation/stationary phase protection protein [Patescibacteria group bacterium]